MRFTESLAFIFEVLSSLVSMKREIKRIVNRIGVESKGRSEVRFTVLLVSVLVVVSLRKGRYSEM